MDFMQNFYLWRDDKLFDEETRNNLRALDEKVQEKEIEDCFYRELEFGTAGLRGVMGVGTNRMNKYTVGKASAGFARYLTDTFGEKQCREKGIVVAFDTRNNSELFAEIASSIFSNHKIKVHFLYKYSPIPVLSFAIRHFGAIGGVVITASHNPKEYNGYKVYDETGCQLGIESSNKVTEYINEIKSYDEINFNPDKSLVERVDVTNEFVLEISKQSIVHSVDIKNLLKIVYTPLNGSGLEPVSSVLKHNNFENVILVKEQSEPDGDFPTLSSPNPGDKNALKIGIDYAKTYSADIVIGTDPDSDRVGVATLDSGEYKLLTGNQIGALFIDFILNYKDISNLNKPVIIKSIVTSNFGKVIAEKRGVKTIETLTGFKFIGEKINEFEEAKLIGDSKKDYDFIFGYEESYGFLCGTHARDKDAVVSSLLICEMAALYKSKGKTLYDRLNELYDEFGYYFDVQENLVMKGKENCEKIDIIMNKLRNEKSPFSETKQVIDYKKDVETEDGFGKFPKSNVLYFVLNDDSWIAVRPSGTEPQIKFYYSIKGKDETAAKERQRMLQEQLMANIKL